MYEQLFDQIGLSPNEQDVYLGLLELGETTRSDIVKKTGISGSKIYDVLERLQQKGLATIYLHNNIKHFKAQHPQQLVNYLDDKKQEIDEQTKQIKEILPTLASTFLKEHTTHEVELLTGLKSLRLFFQQQAEELAEEGTNYVIGGTKGSNDEHIVSFFRNIHKRRERAGIRTRMLYNTRQKETVQRAYSQEEFKNTKTRFIKHTSAVSINIHANKVLIIVFGDELTGIKITSQDVANSFVEYFNLLWELGE